MSGSAPVSRNGDVATPTPSKRAKTRFTNDLQARFCELTAQGMSCAAATRELGVNRSTPYDAAKQDHDFAARWREARETGADFLEDVAYKLATEGGEDVEFDGDGNVRRRTKRAPSAAILARVLQAWRPEKWGDRPAQVAIGVQVVNAEQLEARKTLADLVRGVRVEYPLPLGHETLALPPANPELAHREELEREESAESSRNARLEWLAIQEQRQREFARNTNILPELKP